MWAVILFFFFFAWGLMSFKIINAVKRGSAFMELWPADEPVLKAAFREVRVALMLRKAKWGVPPIVAIVLFMLYYSVGGIQGLRLMVTYPSAFSGYTYLSFATAIMSVLCMLMLVLNGYVWLALQSYQKLTPHQEHFYRELMTQLGKEPVEKPRMFELAQAISEGCKKLKDKSFLEKI